MWERVAVFCYMGSFNELDCVDKVIVRGSYSATSLCSTYLREKFVMGGGGGSRGNIHPSYVYCREQQVEKRK
jgi:hypothetical protein